MPSMFGAQKAQKKLLDDIITNFTQVRGALGQGRLVRVEGSCSTAGL